MSLLAASLAKHTFQVSRARRRLAQLGGSHSAPPVRMIKLTETRAITPYKWVHPDEER